MLLNEMNSQVLKVYPWVKKPFVLQSPSTDCHTTRQVMKSTGEDFLNASHGYYISCVCVCVNN